MTKQRMIVTNCRILKRKGMEQEMSDVKDLYEQMMPQGGFYFDPKHSKVEEGEYCYCLAKEKGEGYFWNYFYEDMFVIEKQNFRFYEDYFLESKEPEFLSIQYFFSVSGEELHPYRQISPNSLRCYVGGNGKTFQALYHKNIPIRSVGINILPAFYQTYLKEKLGVDYINPRTVFSSIRYGTDCQSLLALLKQIQNYHGSGVAARLFYEGKVLEALALILEEAKKNQQESKRSPVSKEDEENLQAVADYIDHHISFTIPAEQLCRIAYMGKTKLKTRFKAYFGCSITEYTIRKRVEESQHLLMTTDLNINEIAKVVGYDRADSFAKQFQKVAGMLPREYRKLKNT